jgi:predicted nucleotidyltransferase component of viral defense system
VIVLIHLLNVLSKDNYLKESFVLKGGTALNLFYFDFPRLSVDIDLNYIGKLDREEMLEERPMVEARLCAAFQQIGLTLYRQPTVHAGGKMVWRYPSCLGGQGNVEVDLNFMYRIPLWPIHFKDSHSIAGQCARHIPVLDIHELAAGKLSALIDRGAGRDIFDTHQLFKLNDIDFKRLRLAFVIYAGMNRKRDLLTFMKEYKHAK